MNEPPDQTAEFSAANLLSPGGMTVAEVLAEELRVLAQRRVAVAEDHALVLEVLLDRVVDDLALVLRRDAGEELPLRLGDAEPVEGVLDVLGDVVPVAPLLIRRADEVEDVLEVDLGEVAAPVRHGLALEDLERAQPELEHPLRLVLQEGDLPHDVRVEAPLGLEHVVRRVVPAKLVLAHPLDLRWGGRGHKLLQVSDEAPAS